MSQEKGDLARVRNNQRRSRARRKEYLSEIEAKLRQYDSRGIEVTAEVQRAARGVISENRKLRRLLAHHGVADEQVESYLRQSTANDTVLMSPNISSVNANQLLEQVLFQQGNKDQPRSLSEPALPHLRWPAGTQRLLDPINSTCEPFSKPQYQQSPVHQLLTPRKTASPSTQVENSSTHDLQSLYEPVYDQHLLPEPSSIFDSYTFSHPQILDLNENELEPSSSTQNLSFLHQIDEQSKQSEGPVTPETPSINCASAATSSSNPDGSHGPKAGTASATIDPKSIEQSLELGCLFGMESEAGFTSMLESMEEFEH